MTKTLELGVYDVSNCLRSGKIVNLAGRDVSPGGRLIATTVEEALAVANTLKAEELDYLRKDTEETDCELKRLRLRCTRLVAAMVCNHREVARLSDLAFVVED